MSSVALGLTLGPNGFSWQSIDSWGRWQSTSFSPSYFFVYIEFFVEIQGLFKEGVVLITFSSSPEFRTNWGGTLSTANHSVSPDWKCWTSVLAGGADNCAQGWTDSPPSHWHTDGASTGALRWDLSRLYAVSVGRTDQKGEWSEWEDSDAPPKFTHHIKTYLREGESEGLGERPGGFPNGEPWLGNYVYLLLQVLRRILCMWRNLISWVKLRSSGTHFAHYLIQWGSFVFLRNSFYFFSNFKDCGRGTTGILTFYSITYKSFGVFC